MRTTRKLQNWKFVRPAAFAIEAQAKSLSITPLECAVP
jgi:hypothetical protein